MIYKSWLSYYRNLGLVSITASLQKQPFSLWYINIALTFQTKAWSNMVTFPSCTRHMSYFSLDLPRFRYRCYVTSRHQNTAQYVSRLSVVPILHSWVNHCEKFVPNPVYKIMHIIFRHSDDHIYIRLIKSLSYYTCSLRQKEIHSDKFNLRATATISPILKI